MRPVAIRFGIQDRTNHGSTDPNALECDWCCIWVAPIAQNVDGRGHTYLRDEEGDIICPDCKLLPPFFVRSGDA